MVKELCLLGRTATHHRSPCRRRTPRSLQESKLPCRTRSRASLVYTARFGSKVWIALQKVSEMNQSRSSEVFRGGPQSGWTGGLAPAARCPRHSERSFHVLRLFLRSSLALSSSQSAPRAPQRKDERRKRISVCRCTTS